MTTTATPPRNSSIRIRWRDLELPTSIEFDKETLTDNYGLVVAEPFERGYGMTVGNSLRRVLISSLEGAAITHIKIKGVAHEFMTVPGVYEDVSQIILNLKRLLLKIEGDQPVTLRIKASSPGVITGADVECDHRTEIVSKDLRICEITKKTDFDMEMTARRGRGYTSAAEHEGEGEDHVIGVIPIDSIYSPVTRVRYRTADTRVGKITNYDKLILEIWTDGTLSPQMALTEAAKILRKHLNPFIQPATLGAELQKDTGEGLAAAVAVAGAEAPLDGSQSELAEKLNMPISHLDLSVRASNCIEAENIKTIGDLVVRSEDVMLEVRNFGKTSLKEIKKKLADLDLSLGMDVAHLLK